MRSVKGIIIGFLLILLGFAVSLLLPDLADQLFLQFAQQMADYLIDLGK